MDSKLSISMWMLFVYVSGAKLLEHLVLNGLDGDSIKAVGKDVPADVNASIQDALKAKDTGHREAVQEFGSSCGILLVILLFIHFHGNLTLIFLYHAALKVVLMTNRLIVTF